MTFPEKVRGANEPSASAEGSVQIGGSALVPPAQKGLTLWTKLDPNIEEMITGSRFLSHAESASMMSVATLFNRRAAHEALLKQTQLKVRFLQHVVLGQYQAVQTILSQLTNLADLGAVLTFKGTVRASSGQVLEGTPLGLGLCAEDMDYTDRQGRKTVDGMAELIMLHLSRLPCETEKKIEERISTLQIAAQFPKDWEQEDEKSHLANLRELHKVRAALGRSTTDAECELALEQFKNYLDAQLSIPIKSGKQWDVGLLLAALELGNNGYTNVEGFAAAGMRDYRNRDLFYGKVIRHIQRLAPDNYAQAMSQGFDSVVERGEKLERRLEFRYGGGSYFSSSNERGLGYEYGAGSRGPRSLPGGRVRASQALHVLLQNFAQAKNIVRQELLRRGLSYRDSHAPIAGAR